MAAGDVWGNSWLASWGSSWAQASTPVVSEPSGTGGRRRGRAPLWRRYADMAPKIDPAALKQEREHLDALIDEADLWSLIDEQSVLREALGYATKAQTKTISAMLKQVERRVAEVEDDEAATIVLIL